MTTIMIVPRRSLGASPEDEAGDDAPQRSAYFAPIGAALKDRIARAQNIELVLDPGDLVGSGLMIM